MYTNHYQLKRTSAFGDGILTNITCNINLCYHINACSLISLSYIKWVIFNLKFGPNRDNNIEPKSQHNTKVVLACLLSLKFNINIPNQNDSDYS